LNDLKTDVKWIKEMLANHLARHERFEVVVFMSLVSALIAAGTGIVSLIVAVSRGKG
jgi:hypothetical protein